MSIPKFTTSRLILRGVCKDDIPSYSRYFVDYEIIRFLSAKVPWPYPDNGVEDFFLNEILPNQGETRWVWGIFLKEAPNELIGAVDLWQHASPENRGFWLGKKFWGNGYMTEAIIPITDFAFDCLGFEKLIFTNAKGNVRSRRVKEKTGARLLSVMATKFVDPNFTESEVWELTRYEWKKVGPNLLHSE